MWHHWATGSHGLLLIRRLNPFCQPRRLFRFAGKHVHWPTKSFYRGSCYLERTSTRPTLTHGRLLGVHGSPHISRQQFRSKLKTHLFRQAYNTAWFLWEQFAEEWNFVIVIVINCNCLHFWLRRDICGTDADMHFIFGRQIDFGKHYNLGQRT